MLLHLCLVPKVRDICSLCCCLFPPHVFTNTVFPLFSLLNIILLTAALNYFTVRNGYCSDTLPHLNETPMRENRWSSLFMKVKAGHKWKTLCRKLEARCDSQIDSHRRCSRATWVRSWNVAPRSAGVLWALRHSPTQCPVHPRGESRKFLTRSMNLPAQLQQWHRPPTWIPLHSLLTSDLELLSSAQRPQSSFRGGMTLQTFAHSSTENFAAQVTMYQASMCGRLRSTELWKISHLSYWRI